MAEGQVIRNDIVQISWKVAKSPTDDIIGDLNKLQKKAKELNGNSTELKKFQNECKKLNAQRFTQLSKSVDNITTKIGTKLVKASTKAAKAMAAVGAAGVAGFTALAKSAVSGYGDYEQLIGGVETLFKDSKDTVVKYANDAYKTAGLSTNEYMETVTSFSASLLQSVGNDTAKAAKQANLAIIDMSDNANKMGTDMESIQNAYQGFAKQNYTMLDNLKLGYGGTKEEMQRLLNDAQKISGQKYDLSSFNDIVQAIHVVQEEIGIAETTSKEASSTIQGSINSMKSAYSNFITGMADPSQDFDQLTSNLVDSVVTVAKNLIPRIKMTIPRLAKGLGEVIQESFNTAMANVKDLGPIGSALQSIVDKIKAFVSNKDKMQIIKDTFSSIKSTIGNIVPILSNVVSGALDFVTSTGMLKTVKTIFDGINKVVGGVKDNFSWLKEVVIAVGSAFLIFGAAVKIVSTGFAIYNGILKVYKTFQLIATVAQFGFNSALLACPISWIVIAIVGLIAVIVLLVRNWDKVKEVAGKCWNKIKETWGKVSNWFKETVVQPVKEYFSGLWDSITDKASEVKNKIVDAFKTAVDKVKNAWGGIKDWFADIWKQTVKAVAKPVNKLIDGANWVLEKVGSDKKFNHWEPYARGTNGHPGGNAIVNDGRGAELVQMPNGFTFIPKGRNVGIPNAPKGMKVLNAERTAQLMGKTHPTFNYENGSGWLDNIFDFFDNAGGLAGKVIEKFVNLKDMGGYALDVGKGIVSKAKETMVDWIKNLFNEFGGKSLAAYEPSKGVEQWRSTVANALKIEGLHSEANVKRTLHQMQTESGGNPKAINLWDSNAEKGIPSKGLMQVIDPTFKSYARKGYDKNIYDPMSNILASVRYATSRYGSLEKAYRGVGYADGIGTLKLPVYNPESSVSTSRTSSTHNNNYAPSFTLNMSGTVDRTTERTIKRWVQEALEEMFDSMSRTSPRLTEV